MALTERYVRADATGTGDGTTDVSGGANGAWTWAQALAGLVAGMRINVRAGTYNRTTSADNPSVVGTQTAPIWFRGFKTTPGDMDAEDADHGTFASGTQVPFISYTTGNFSDSGSRHVFTNLDFRSAAAAPTFRFGTVQCLAYRVRVENTNANSAAYAAAAANTHDTFLRCWFKADAAAARVLDIPATGQAYFAYCVYVGGTDGVWVGTSGLFYRSLFRQHPGYGVRVISGATAHTHVIACSFDRTGLSPVYLAATPQHCNIWDNIFSAWASGYAIHNDVGSNVQDVVRFRNAFYDILGANIESGFGDSPAFDAVAEPSDPFVDAVAGDLNLKVGAAARGATLVFPNFSTTTSYGDRGAAQHEDAGGGSYTAAANVRSGTDRGDGVLGTLVVPAASVVLTGTTFDNGTAGTATVPTASQVLVGIAYGAGGNAITGNVVLPSAGNVRAATTYGPSGGTTGTLTAPSLANTKTGVAGDGGTGTYDGSDRWTDPGVGNVEAGVAYKANSTTNNRTGTFAAPTPDKVELGEGYGADGTEFTGTLDPGGGSYPTTSEIAAAVAVRTLADVYPASGVAPTLEQAVMMILQTITDFSIAAGVKTVRKRTSATTAFALTLTPSSAPTASAPS